MFTKIDQNAALPPDHDLIKALIASESSFEPDPKTNRKITLEIAQITKQTLKIVQDPNGELIYLDLPNTRE